MSFTNKIGSDGYGKTVSTYKINAYPQYQTTFYGTSASVAYSASIYYQKGWTVKVTTGQPYEMEANLSCEVGGADGITPITGTGSFVTVNWSLHYKTTEKEILHADASVIPWINQITVEDKTKLDNLISNPPKDGSVDWTTFATGSSVTASQVVWKMLSSGTKTVPVVTPILRQSMIVPSSYNMTSFNTNVYRIYVKSSLSSAIGIPSNWYAIMPQATDPDVADTNGLPYHYGWQKQPPTQDQNGTTITIQQEFEYGLYPQNIYGTTI